MRGTRGYVFGFSKKKRKGLFHSMRNRGRKESCLSVLEQNHLTSTRTVS